MAMEAEPHRGVLNKWIERLEQATGTKIDGGARIQAREVLKDASWYGQTWADRLLDDERPATEAPEGASRDTESAGGPDVAGEVSEVKEDPTESPDGWSELRGWWEQTAHDEIDGFIDKMEEYGGISRATDLIAIGKSLVAAGVPAPEPTDEVYTELGIWFYLRGKLARWEAAVAEGRRVSDDTLLDSGVYVRMAQRARQTGGWPV